ncbi:hypothetical protein [Streptomyces sp. NPDC050264]
MASDCAMLARPVHQLRRGPLAAYLYRIDRALPVHSLASCYRPST